MNLVNEQLASVRRQKTILKKQMDEEINRTERIKIANKIRLLNNEEKDLLNQLGVNL